MIDIDFFKKINDTYGHKIGDAVIVNIAKVIAKSVRPMDTSGRWGGEEFLIVLPDTNQEDAIVVAQRILTTVSQETLLIDEFEINVTLSIGVATYKNTQSVTHFIEGADMALYNAKNNGRNRIEIA